MAFIGIVSDNKNENNINNLIKKIKKENQVIYITEENIENIKNVKFETILSVNRLINNESLKKIISTSKYLIINSDIEDNLNLLKELNLTIITYGYNSKATLTASSIEDDTIIVCLQRQITNAKNKMYEPQEIKICMQENIKSETVYEIMGGIILLILYENNES